jgi:hypothetical protein
MVKFEKVKYFNHKQFSLLSLSTPTSPLSHFPSSQVALEWMQACLQCSYWETELGIHLLLPGQINKPDTNYYSIIVDSTLDVTNTDQLTITVH